MDELTRFMNLFDKVFDGATWKAVFGEPQAHGDRVIIPVSTMSYGFGLGMGRGNPTVGEDQDPMGGGGGAGGRSHPVALIEVTPEKTIIRPVLDWSKIIGAALFMICWVNFWWSRPAMGKGSRRTNRGR